MPGRGGGRGAATDFNAYLRIGADGRVTGMSGKAELGQGAMTSLAQLVAEELDVAFDRVDMVLGDTDVCPYDMGTFGSMSMLQFGPVLRRGGRGSPGGAGANGRRTPGRAGGPAARQGRRGHGLRRRRPSGSPTRSWWKASASNAICTTCRRRTRGRSR